LLLTYKNLKCMFLGMITGFHSAPEALQHNKINVKQNYLFHTTNYWTKITRSYQIMIQHVIITSYQVHACIVIGFIYVLADLQLIKRVKKIITIWKEKKNHAINVCNIISRCRSNSMLKVSLISIFFAKSLLIIQYFLICTAS